MVNIPSYLSPKRAGSRTVYFVSEFKRIIPFVALLAIKAGALEIDLSIYPVSQSFDQGYVSSLTSYLGDTVPPILLDLNNYHHNGASPVESREPS